VRAQLWPTPSLSGQLQAIAFFDNLGAGATLIRVLNFHALVGAYIWISTHILVVDLHVQSVVLDQRAEVAGHVQSLPVVAVNGIVDMKLAALGVSGNLNDGYRKHQQREYGEKQASGFHVWFLSV
jgi:hypothetical protein